MTVHQRDEPAASLSSMVPSGRRTAVAMAWGVTHHDPLDDRWPPTLMSLEWAHASSGGTFRSSVGFAHMDVQCSEIRLGRMDARVHIMDERVKKEANPSIRTGLFSHVRKRRYFSGGFVLRTIFLAGTAPRAQRCP